MNFFMIIPIILLIFGIYYAIKTSKYKKSPNFNSIVYVSYIMITTCLFILSLFSFHFAQMI